MSEHHASCSCGQLTLIARGEPIRAFRRRRYPSTRSGAIRGSACPTGRSARTDP